MTRRSSTDFSTRVRKNVNTVRPGDLEVYGTSPLDEREPQSMMLWLTQPNVRAGWSLWFTGCSYSVIETGEVGNIFEEHSYYAVVVSG